MAETDLSSLDKIYIWGFPGIGKSHIVSNGRVHDADCERFKYVFSEAAPDELHVAGKGQHIDRDPNYPDNYWTHVKTVEASIILLNCHISLLDHIDKERLILVYPSESLKAEYMERYRRRGDHRSFIDYMDDNFNDMVSAIRQSPYRVYEVSAPNTYLQNLLDGGKLMDQFMTKPELTELFKESLELGTIKAEGVMSGRSPAELAQMFFEGEFRIDLAEAKSALAAKKQSIEEERQISERCGGLSREDLADKIMKGIVNGALGIRYAEVAPYSHGYEITFGEDGSPGSTRKFTNRWTSYDGDLFSAPRLVADLISKGMQHNEIFGTKCGPVDINKILRTIDEMEQNKITSFTPEKDTDFVRATSPNRYPYRSSVATVMDVHAGKGLDGIVQHHYHGDYSTITPVKQNQLVESLVCLKGFCLDCVHDIDTHPKTRQGIIDYLKEQGTDISTPEKLQEWIKANPSKCGLAVNRERPPSLNNQISLATDRVERSGKPSDGQTKSFPSERSGLF